MPSQELLDGNVMALIGHVLTTKFSQKCIIFPMNIGKSKPSKKSKTPHVRTKIWTQNRLRSTIHQNQQEWIDACREASEAINVAKAESWKDLLQDAMSSSDGPNMSKVIQGLNDTPGAKSPNEAMSHNGCTITNIKSKVDIFINHYARVSILNMSQAD